MLTWAMAVNKTLEQGHAYNDGLKVIENIYNLTFKGLTGNIVINAVGDRSPDYIIQSYQNGRSIPILKWSASERQLYKVFKPEDQDDWSGLYWFSNATAIPADSPACGWSGELCSRRNRSYLVMVTIVTLTVLLAALCILMATFHILRYCF